MNSKKEHCYASCFGIHGCFCGVQVDDRDSIGQWIKSRGGVNEGFNG